MPQQAMLDFALIFALIFTTVPLVLAAIPRLRQGCRWGKRSRHGAPISAYGALAWAGVGAAFVLLTIVVRIHADTAPWPLLVIAIAFANLVFAAYRDNRQHRSINDRP